MTVSLSRILVSKLKNGERNSFRVTKFKGLNVDSCNFSNIDIFTDFFSEAICGENNGRRYCRPTFVVACSVIASSATNRCHPILHTLRYRCNPTVRPNVVHSSRYDT